jgi:hypothetical protein
MTSQELNYFIQGIGLGVLFTLNIFFLIKIFQLRKRNKEAQIRLARLMEAIRLANEVMVFGSDLISNPIISKKPKTKREVN